MPTYRVSTPSGRSFSIDSATEPTPAFIASLEADNPTGEVSAPSPGNMPAEASKARQAGAMAAGMAVRTGAALVGGAAGLATAGPAGAAMLGAGSTMAAEPVARSVEAWLLQRPVQPMKPIDYPIAAMNGVGGMTAPVKNAFMQHAIPGAAQGAIYEAGEQAKSGKFSVSDLTISAGANALMSGVFGKVLSGRDGVKAKSAAKVAKFDDPLPQPIRKGDIVELPDGTSVLATQDVVTPGAVKDVVAQQPSIVPGEVGAVRQRGLIASAKNNPGSIVADPLKQSIDDYYRIKPNVETAAEASKVIAGTKGGLDGAKELFLRADHGLSPEVHNAVGLELIDTLQRTGQFEDASNVLYTLGRQATTHGRAIQFLSRMSRNTDKGLLIAAGKNKGSPLTADEIAQGRKLWGDVGAAGSAPTKLARTFEAWGWANGFGEIGKDEKARAFLNIAMLLNPKTLIRNVGGNASLNMAEVAADQMAAAADAGVSVFTNRRTKLQPFGAGDLQARVSGYLQPVNDFELGRADAIAAGNAPWSRHSIQRGLDTMASLAKLTASGKMELGDVSKVHRQVFTSPTAQALEKTLGIAMGAGDRAFYQAAHNRSINESMQIARNAGADIVTPDADMVSRASLEAARAIFQDENFVSKNLGKLRGTLNSLSTLGRSTQIGAGQAIVPFAQVPGSILMRGIEYSPVGFVQALYKDVAPLLMKREMTADMQRDLVNRIGRAGAGTGLAASGYLLAKWGVARALPHEDPDVEAVMKQAGFGRNSINVSALKRRMIAMNFQPGDAVGELQDGDISMPFDSLIPAAMPVAFGMQAAQEGSGGKINAGTAGIKAGIVTLESQPLLMGLKNTAESIAASDSLIAGVAAQVASLPLQAIPTLSGQAAQYSDPIFREVKDSDWSKTLVNTIQSRLPLLSEQLPARADTWGKVMNRNANAVGPLWFNTFANPIAISRINMTPQGREVMRLFGATGEVSHAPGRSPMSISIKLADGTNARADLSAQDRAKMQVATGVLINTVYSQLVVNPDYQALSDTDKQKELAKYVSAAGSAAKTLMFGHRPERLTDAEVSMTGLLGLSRPDLMNIPEFGGKKPNLRDPKVRH